MDSHENPRVAVMHFFKHFQLSGIGCQEQWAYEACLPLVARGVCTSAQQGERAQGVTHPEQDKEGVPGLRCCKPSGVVSVLFRFVFSKGGRYRELSVNRIRMHFVYHIMSFAEIPTTKKTIKSIIQ